MSAVTYTRADPDALRANVPEDMRLLPMWLLWSQGSAAKGGGKPKKIPYYANGDARNGTLDTEADRKQLVTFQDAMAVYECDHGRYLGPGIALGPVPGTSLILSGIDLDKCVRDGAVLPKAQRVVDAFGSYAEISPSATGVKAFGTGDIGKTTTDVLEIYSGARFFTVTGVRLSGDRLGDLGAAATLARELLLADANQRGRVAYDGAIPDGARNNTLFVFAASLRAKNVDKADAWRALQTRNADCRPPLDGNELKQILESAYTYAPGFPLTDTGNAERFAAQHPEHVRYLIGGGWYLYSDHRFIEDRERRVSLMLTDVTRGIYREAAEADSAEHRKALGAWAKTSESRDRVSAALSMAEPRMADALEKYDANPYLIGLANGVYDLERDEFRAGRPDDRITLAMDVSYDANATCPRWEQFQSQIHAEKPDMVAFKRRAWGYNLSGNVSEQKINVCFGGGKNGKTQEQKVALSMFGDYGRKIEPETLMVRKGGGASNDIARLRGARFVATVEIEDGGRLAESLVKQLTGGDRMCARFLYQEYIEFDPTWKIWIATNHRPEVIGTDYAIWRRIVLIPYLVRFTDDEDELKDAFEPRIVNKLLRKADPNLLEKLLQERSGILNWMLQGYREWKVSGLAPPETVQQATNEYKADMDRVGNFLRECCKHGADVKAVTPAAKVYRAYRGWMLSNGQFPLSAKKFHAHMRDDHRLPRVERQAWVYVGVALTAQEYDEIDA